jgi:hypothetical protein
LATANKLHEATTTAGASQAISKTQATAGRSHSQTSACSSISKNKHNKDQHKKTTPITTASARAEEVISSSGKKKKNPTTI